VNNIQARRIIESRFTVAIFAGILLALAFPRVGIAGLAWIAPGLLALAGLGTRGWESFRIGYVGGLAYYLVSLNWLLRIPYRWLGIPLGPAVGLLALSAFLAIYPGIWVWFLSGAWRKPTLSGVEASQGGGTILSWAKDTVALENFWVVRFAWALCGAAAWVAIEMCIARFLSGFPWDLLGVSQYRMLPLIQVAAITGVYGISFVVAWTSLSLLLAGLAILERPAMRYAWLSEIILPLATVSALFLFGIGRTRQTDESVRELKVTFVQPSIPQTLIWDSENDEARFREIIDLSSKALTNKTDLLLWPEAAVPGLVLYNQDHFDALTGLARSKHVWMIVGADDAEPKKNARRKDDLEFFNSSFLISPDGRLEARYRKRNLVIFGEYVPLMNFLPFIKYLTPWIGGVFTPGTDPVPFVMPGLHAKTSILICFEDVFPQLAREYVSEDTDFLVNLTNNGWFGEGAAQWQHGMTALFRAVENGLPLVRCSNNGLTCWVDRHGRIRQIFHDSQGTIYGKGIMTARIPLLQAKRPPTFYNAHGDWFGWTCVAIVLLQVAARAAIWCKRKSSERA
jgi:apolipoprotein N-acyltransferase